VPWTPAERQNASQRAHARWRAKREGLTGIGHDRFIPTSGAQPPALTFLCLFFDHGAKRPRHVALDCRPAKFIRLDPSPAGLIRRTWLLRELDTQGCALYFEQPPQLYREPNQYPKSKAMREAEG